MARGYRLIGVGAAVVVLSACSVFKGASELPNDQVMIAVCEEFVRAKPTIASQVSLDGLRPYSQQIFGIKDLKAIKAANDELNNFCPAPDGYAPLPSTVTASKAALAVIASYLTPNDQGD